jgi:hypothetical protein
VLWIHLPALQRKNHNRNQNRRLLVPGVKGWELERKVWHISINDNGKRAIPTKMII